MNKAVYHRTSWLPLALSLAGVLIAVAMIGPNVKAQCDPNPGGGPLPPCDPDGNYCSPIS